MNQISKKHNIFDEELLSKLMPKSYLRMGRNPHTMPPFKPLVLPNINKFSIGIYKTDKKERGEVFAELTKIGGIYLSSVIKLNSSRFRIFSPDELESNKLDDVFTETHRNSQWDKELANKGGRVIEILSEHTCQGWMQGYSLTGRFSLFPSYETFLGIITTMMIQYAKFIKVAKETAFRTQVPSLNYLETSTLWRQEHNGFSHQDPMFINNLLNMKSSMIRIYFPPDVNCFLTTMEHCLMSRNKINLIVGTKNQMPVYLSMEEAKQHCTAGASVWKWASTDNGLNPDVVLCGIGNETNLEVIEAAKLLRRDCPTLRVRVVNLTDLLILDATSHHPHTLDNESFNSLFTETKPVVINFHGYPSAIKQLLFGRSNPSRFVVHGYIEEGTTTTPFKMLTVNKSSRYDVSISALKKSAIDQPNSMIAIDHHLLVSNYQHKLRLHDRYIKIFGKDPEDLNNLLDIEYVESKRVTQSG